MMQTASAENKVAHAQRSVPETKFSPDVHPLGMTPRLGNQAMLRLQRKCDCGGSSGSAGQCAACKEQEEMGLQRSAAGPAESDFAPPIVHQVLRSPGQPLDADTRAFMEQRFGQDFKGVRIHTDTRAAQSARAVKALAYTVGQHIVFAQPQRSYATAADNRLLAHELAHVIQQARGGPVTSTVESRTLEDSANRAAEGAAHGYQVSVAGSSGVGIARQSLFDQFSGGHYSWTLLQAALTHSRPVDTIVSDINALPSADRDQAIKDITAERTNQARKLADLRAKQNAQTDPRLQAVFDPMFTPIEDVISSADRVLDALFVNIAASETPASLKAGTVAPTAAQKPLIESALKPDLRVTSSGAPEPFQENLAGDPKSYLDKLRGVTPPLIEGHFQQQVVNRGEAEHKDPAKVHALSELERIGNASARETDNVFGQYKKGPALKADTKTSRGNIHDLWQDTEAQLKGMNAGQKREMARQLVFYFFRSDREVLDVNAVHNADAKFTGGAPVNQEAKDQKQVADESTSTAEAVKRLNQIDRGWDASAQAGQVNVQIFRQPDQTTGPLAGPKVADRDFMWDMFQTLVHEYLHTLAHPDYNKYAEHLPNPDQTNTLIEGVDSLLDEVVWSAVAPKVNDQKLRDDVEGPEYSHLPPTTVFPASRRRYDSYAQAVKLVNIVGIRNLYAAYFLGDVEKIKG